MVVVLTGQDMQAHCHHLILSYHRATATVNRMAALGKKGRIENE